MNRLLKIFQFIFFPVLCPIRTVKNIRHRIECRNLDICYKCGDSLKYSSVGRYCESCRKGKQKERETRRTEIRSKITALRVPQDARRAELRAQLQKQLDENQKKLLNKLMEDLGTEKL